MTLPEILSVSATGFIVVLIVLILLAVIIVMLSKVIQLVEGGAKNSSSTEKTEENIKKAEFCFEGGLKSFVEYINENRKSLSCWLENGNR